MKKVVFLLLVLAQNLFAQYWETFGPNKGIIGNIKSFYQESDSVIWLGNSGSIPKLYKFNGDSVIFTFSPGQFSGSTSLNTIIQDSTGKYWIMGGLGGLFTFQESDTSWEHFASLTGIGIEFDKFGQLWLVHGGGGNSVSKFDGNNWTLFTTANSILTSNHVHTLAKDKDGNIYVGAEGWVPKISGNNWTNLFNPSMCNGLSLFDNAPRTIFVTENNKNLLLGTQEGGIIIFDSLGNCLDSFLPDSLGIKSNAIKDIMQDSQGNIWVAYGFDFSGVSKYNGSFWEHYTTNYHISEIIEDRFEYKLWFLTGSNEIYSLKPDSIVNITENLNSLPEEFSLSQNYPNPFNSNTKINYELPNNFSLATLTIYNILGKEVKQWKLNKLTGKINWNGTDNFNNPVSSGVYLYQLKVGNSQQTKKMILLK